MSDIGERGVVSWEGEKYAKCVGDEGGENLWIHVEGLPGTKKIWSHNRNDTEMAGRCGV